MVATADGVSAITMTDLVRTSLRLRPDRLVLGEIRGAEVIDMLQALNTGHDGSMSTCHANSALDALRRIEALVVQHAPGWPIAAVREQVAALDAFTAERADAEGGTVTVFTYHADRVPPGVGPVAPATTAARVSASGGR